MDPQNTEKKFYLDSEWGQGTVLHSVIRTTGPCLHQGIVRREQAHAVHMHRPLVPVVQPDGDELLAAGGGHGGDGARVEEAQLAAPVAADARSHRHVADQARPYLKAGCGVHLQNG